MRKLKNKPTVLVLRFSFKHNSLKRNRIVSFLQIPVFTGLLGFQEKLWTFDPETGTFQGLYQWQSEKHAEGYLSSFATNKGYQNENR